jgi:hypothetical protein
LREQVHEALAVGARVVPADEVLDLVFIRMDRTDRRQTRHVRAHAGESVRLFACTPRVVPGEPLQVSEEVLCAHEEALARPCAPREAERVAELARRAERAVIRNGATAESEELGRRGDALEQRGLSGAVLADEEGDGDIHVERRERSDLRYRERIGSPLAVRLTLRRDS